MAAPQSSQSQGMGVTVLPNGHNATAAKPVHYLPSSYRAGHEAVGIAAVVVLLALLATVAVWIGRVSLWAGPVTRGDPSRDRPAV